MGHEACVVLVTCGSKAEAGRIAERLIEERLAACINLVGDGSPVLSVYMWEGVLQREQETLMLIKTMRSRLDDLQKRIRELHSYSVPEFVALPIIAGSDDYIQWMSQSVK